MQTTILSSKGQVVIPMNLRKAHQWGPGTELMVEDTPQGVLLRPVKPVYFPPSTIDDVMGCIQYNGPSFTNEEIDALLMADMRAHHQENQVNER